MWLTRYILKISGSLNIIFKSNLTFSIGNDFVVQGIRGIFKQIIYIKIQLFFFCFFSFFPLKYLSTPNLIHRGGEWKWGEKEGRGRECKRIGGGGARGGEGRPHKMFRYKLSIQIL